MRQQWAPCGRVGSIGRNDATADYVVALNAPPVRQLCETVVWMARGALRQHDLEDLVVDACKSESHIGPNETPTLTS